MVRGCQKKIIYLKNTGSDVFDEAYFIINDKALSSEDDVDMVKEANRILDECFIDSKKAGKIRKITKLIGLNAVSLTVGIALGIIIILTIK